jgi:alpha-ribazole phosphatase
MEVLYPGSDAEVVAELTECDFGEFENRTAAELQDNEAFKRWITGAEPNIPGGEDSAAFQARIMAAFESIVEDVMKKGDGDAVICTHGGVIMLIMAAYALPQADVSAWGAEAGCGFTLRVSPSLWMREPVAEAIAYVPIIKE